ncbi:MAG: galactokinase, partial [Streptomycetales bacterium]
MGLPAAALTARLGETFRELAGRAPAGWWAAPGRVNVIGDHTDYNEGFALPMAIDRHVLVAGASRGDGEVRVRSLQQGYAAFRVGGLAPGSVRGWAAYLAGVVWALRDTGHDVGGADLALDSTVPAGSGLSSSAALECAACLALCDLYGLGLTTAEIARLAQRAENDYVGMPCGVMDQLAATHGRAGNVLLLDAREVAVRPEPFDLPGAGLALAVIDTRAERRLIEGGYAERRSACEAAARMLGVRALRDVAVEGLAAATERLAPT